MRRYPFQREVSRNALTATPHFHGEQFAHGRFAPEQLLEAVNEAQSTLPKRFPVSSQEIANLLQQHAKEVPLAG